jgi:hypothetical protein
MTTTPAKSHIGPITARAFSNPAVVGQPERYNDCDMIRIELPASNGIGTARSVATVCGELAIGSPRLGNQCRHGLCAHPRCARSPARLHGPGPAHVDLFLGRVLQAVGRVRVRLSVGVRGLTGRAHPQTQQVHPGIDRKYNANGACDPPTATSCSSSCSNRGGICG